MVGAAYLFGDFHPAYVTHELSTTKLKFVVQNSKIFTFVTHNIIR